MRLCVNVEEDPFSDELDVEKELARLLNSADKSDELQDLDRYSHFCCLLSLLVCILGSNMALVARHICVHRVASLQPHNAGEASFDLPAGSLSACSIRPNMRNTPSVDLARQSQHSHVI